MQTAQVARRLAAIITRLDRDALYIGRLCDELRDYPAQPHYQHRKIDAWVLALGCADHASNLQAMKHTLTTQSQLILALLAVRARPEATHATVAQRPRTPSRCPPRAAAGCV